MQTPNINTNKNERTLLYVKYNSTGKMYIIYEHSVLIVQIQ